MGIQSIWLHCRPTSQHQARAIPYTRLPKTPIQPVACMRMLGGSYTTRRALIRCRHLHHRQGGYGLPAGEEPPQAGRLSSCARATTTMGRACTARAGARWGAYLPVPSHLHRRPTPSVRCERRRWGRLDSPRSSSSPARECWAALTFKQGGVGVRNNGCYSPYIPLRARQAVAHQPNCSEQWLASAWRCLSITLEKH